MKEEHIRLYDNKSTYKTNEMYFLSEFERLTECTLDVLILCHFYRTEMASVTY